MLNLTNQPFKFLGISLLLIFSFRGILNTPIESIGYTVEHLLIPLITLFSLIYFLDLLIKRKFKFFHLLGIILCTLPIIAALSAKFEFNQPLIYGLLSQRDYFLILTGYLLYYLLDTKIISLNMLESSFVKVSWVTLILFSLTILFVDPEQYVKTGIVGFKEIKGGYVFRFQMIFILFGAIYYIIKGIRKKKLLHFIYAGLFIYYVLFIRQDRTTALFLLFTIVVLSFGELSLKKLLGSFAIGFIVLLCLIVYAYLIEYDGLNQIGQLYYDTYLTLQGETLPGEKEDVRWSEIEIAMKYIKKNPIWGNGELSRQWNDGFNQLGRFYPSDIGIFGIIFIYGIIGFLIACLQITYAYILHKRIRSKSSIFVSAATYTALMFYINSLSDGSLVQRTAIGMTMISIMYFYWKTLKEKQT